jgi:hypothetical protein
MFLCCAGTKGRARMAKSADAADLKSADPRGLWGFKSPSGHHRESHKTSGYEARVPDEENSATDAADLALHPNHERKLYPI